MNNVNGMTPQEFLEGSEDGVGKNVINQEKSGSKKSQNPSVTFQVSHALKQRMNKIMLEKEISLSAFVREAIREKLEREEKR